MFGSTRMQTIFSTRLNSRQLNLPFFRFLKLMYSSHQYSSRVLYRKGKTMFAKVKRKIYSGLEKRGGNLKAIYCKMTYNFVIYFGLEKVFVKFVIANFFLV